MKWLKVVGLVLGFLLLPVMVVTVYSTWQRQIDIAAQTLFVLFMFGALVYVAHEIVEGRW